PAHNEQKEILRTLWALTAQHRAPDLMVCIPNGCTDNTAELARSVPGVIVLELPKLQHKKSEALNIAWNQYAKDADIVVCLDADTIIPPNAIADWEEEFLTDLASTPLPDISAREAMV